MAQAPKKKKVKNDVATEKVVPVQVAVPDEIETLEVTEDVVTIDIVSTLSYDEACEIVNGLSASSFRDFAIEHGISVDMSLVNSMDDIREMLKNHFK